MNNILYHHDSRMAGFGSSVTVAFSTIKYSINNNLSCHVDIRNQMYGSLEQNLWDLFLKQPFNVSIDKNYYNYYDKTDPFKLNCWEYPNMDIALQKLRDNNHILQYQNLYKKFFLLKDDILEPVNNFYSNFKDKSILGFHRRGRDQLSTRGHVATQQHGLDINYLYSVVDMEIDKLKSSVLQRKEFKGGKVLTLRAPVDNNH